MIKIISNNEKLIDELNLVVKLFYTIQDIEDLDIDFTVEQVTTNKDIHTVAYSNCNDFVVTRDDKIVDINFPERSRQTTVDYHSTQCPMKIIVNPKVVNTKSGLWSTFLSTNL